MEKNTNIDRILVEYPWVDDFGMTQRQKFLGCTTKFLENFCAFVFVRAYELYIKSTKKIFYSKIFFIFKS